MNEIINLIIVTLATYGLSYPITSFSGPNNLFVRLRDRFSVLECTVCFSMWVAILFFVILLLGFGYYLTPLAIVGVVILLERI